MDPDEYTDVCPNRGPLNRGFCPLFYPFSKNLEIKDLIKVRYFSLNKFKVTQKLAKIEPKVTVSSYIQLKIGLVDVKNLSQSASGSQNRENQRKISLKMNKK